MDEINAGEGGERVVVSGTFRLPPGGLYAKPDDPVVVGVVAEDAEGRLVVEVGRDQDAIDGHNRPMEQFGGPVYVGGDGKVYPSVERTRAEAEAMMRRIMGEPEPAEEPEGSWRDRPPLF